MQANKMRYVVTGLLVALILVVGMWATVDPAVAQAARTRFNAWVTITRLTVEDTLTLEAGNLTVTAGDVYAGDDVTAQDDVILFGDAVVGAFVNPVRIGQAVVNGQPITPTGTYMYLSATAAVTPSLIYSGSAQGQMLILQMASNQNLLLVESGRNINLSAASVTLAQNDTMTLIWDGTDWVQLATSNN